MSFYRAFKNTLVRKIINDLEEGTPEIHTCFQRSCNSVLEYKTDNIMTIFMQKQVDARQKRLLDSLPGDAICPDHECTA